MWIILLDHSGSMGNPFTGKKEFAGRSKTSKATIKLNAAKQALLEHLQGLGSPSDIALIEFTSSASVVFEGLSNNLKGIQHVLDSLRAEDGTDISVALDVAAEYERTLQNVLTVRILVISDGLSDRDRAEAAARRLAARRVIIDLILIDPTEKGESAARAITAMNGSLWAVTSPEKLSEQIATAGEQERAQAEQAAEIVGEYYSKAAAVTGKIQDEDRLTFTVGYPGVVSPKVWYSLLIYLHTAKLKDQVEDILRQRVTQLGLRPAKSTMEAFSQIKRETVLKFTPRIEGFVFNPPTPLEVIWYEDIQDISFRLKAESYLTGRSVLGSIEVEVGPILIAQIPLSIRVRAPSEPEEAVEPTTAITQSYRNIFCSYSHKDKNVVEACKAAYEALAISVYIDKYYLKSGEEWNPALRQLILESDLFQLYWSEVSRLSKNVEEEWRYALSIVGQKGECFIRPVRWEEPFPEVPRELAHIHFWWLDIDALVRHIGHPISLDQPSGPPQLSQTETSLPLHTTVLPILSGTSREVIAVVRDDVARAVTFLEEVTGLRYYPAPTLLVDDYAVKSVRALNTVDLPPTDSTHKDEVFALADIIQSICLCFHGRFSLWDVHPEKVNIDNVSGYLGSGSVITEAQFKVIKRECEYAIRLWIEGYFAPKWQCSLSDLTSQLPGIHIGQSLSSFVLRVLDNVLVMMLERAKSSRTMFEIFLDIDHDIWTYICSEMELSGITSTKIDSWRGNFVLKGTFPAFVRTLVSLRDILARRLPEYDSYDRTSAKNPDDAGIHCLAVATAVGRICYELSGVTLRSGELKTFIQSGITLGDEGVS